MKISIAGTGKIVGEVLEMLSQEFEGKIEVTGIYAREKSVEHAIDLCMKYAPNGFVFTDYDRMLQEAEADYVYVANANHVHHEYALKAMQSGHNVLVEKPIAITVERTDRMIAACRETATPLGCIFQTRWTDEFRNAKARVESGELGRITYGAVRIPWWRADEYYTDSSWHGKWKMDGGGALMNQSIQARHRGYRTVRRRTRRTMPRPFPLFCRRTPQA